MTHRISSFSSIAVAFLWLVAASRQILSCEASTLHQKYANMCSGNPKITRKHEKTLKWLFKNIGENQIGTRNTPQNEAACWVFRDNKGFSVQRFVMATIYYATAGAAWDINTDWITRKHECSWYGVQCSMSRKVVNLDLGYIQVDGLVPREIGLLKDLRDLDLHGNDLQGVIPHKLMAGLKKLEFFRIHMNGMFGALHKEIMHMKALKELYAFGNYIAGSIPKELATLKNLGTYVTRFWVNAKISLFLSILFPLLLSWKENWPTASFEIQSLLPSRLSIFFVFLLNRGYWSLRKPTYGNHSQWAS